MFGGPWYDKDWEPMLYTILKWLPLPLCLYNVVHNRRSRNHAWSEILNGALMATLQQNGNS